MTIKLRSGVSTPDFFYKKVADKPDVMNAQDRCINYYYMYCV
jgi:hypothetical protein